MPSAPKPEGMAGLHTEVSGLFPARGSGSPEGTDTGRSRVAMVTALLVFEPLEWKLGISIPHNDALSYSHKNVFSNGDWHPGPRATCFHKGRFTGTQPVENQRHSSANKDPYSQGCGLRSSRVGL